ncbi:MAG: hypothetical protein KKB03_02245 [Nanoarchaeota archaeon]|nr:hypothetical protein [Nanoarchaeota archaeon]MBU1135313.1 hypothetical protein [Nanoarchaeota archaeon]MBU2520039.1 hypothetical protein [Nanoarchaeota archaeon]
MIDWRILAASFAGLIVVSSLVVGGFGGNIFSDLLDNVGNWLGSSPFGGFFSTPEVKTHEVDMTIYPVKISLDPELSVNLSTDDTVIENFKGTISFDFEEQKMLLEESSTSLKFELPIKNMEINNFKLNSFSADNIKLKIAPDIVSENGSIQLQNFFGKVIVTTENLKLEGNVSKIVAKIGDNTWELK